MQDEDVLAFDTVNNDIFSTGKAPQAGTEVLVAAASHIGMLARRKNRCVMESITRSAISMLPLSLAM
jgi:hypothetical protein